MIRKVSEENEMQWAELCIALWSEDNAEVLIEQRKNGQFENEFLYFMGEEAVAFISLSIRHDYVEGTSTSPVGYLEGIYVKPSFRRQGIAKQMITYAKEWCKEQGCSEMGSDCEWDNETSRRFHNQIGFQEANRIICFSMKLD